MYQVLHFVLYKCFLTGFNQNIVQFVNIPIILNHDRTQLVDT